LLGTTLLLTAQSNRFIDNSSNNFALTPGSAPKVQAISPFSPSSPYSVASHGGGARFDGTNNYLAVPHSALGTQDFTIETWINTWDFGTVPQVLIGNVVNSGASGTQWELVVLTDGLIKLQGWFPTYIGSNSAIKLNNWNHIAVTRSGSTFRIYINGVLDNTTTDTSNFSSAVDLYIGREYYGATTWNIMHSYLSGLRVVTGTALYTGATLTVPTTPPTAVANTSLLLNFTNSGIYDAHASNAIETVSSSQVTTATSKFAGSSFQFNGTSDYLSIPNSNNFDFGTGDFTIEGWFNSNNVSNTQQLISFSKEPYSNGNDDGFGLHIQAPASVLKAYFYSGTTQSLLTGTTVLSNNTWYYVKYYRQNGTTYLYLGNNLEATASQSSSVNSPTGAFLKIGKYAPASPQYFNGYLEDWRITRGIGRPGGTTPTSAFPSQ
jgi:hypothetical protein